MITMNASWTFKIHSLRLLIGKRTSSKAFSKIKKMDHKTGLNSG